MKSCSRQKLCEGKKSNNRRNGETRKTVMLKNV